MLAVVVVVFSQTLLAHLAAQGELAAAGPLGHLILIEMAEQEQPIRVVAVAALLVSNLQI